MYSLCVYCGSRTGHNPLYVQAARQLGQKIAQMQIRLIYGGGAVGLMGTVATAALSAGGEAVGIIPRQLYELEVAHLGLSRLEIVDSMHERKTRMFELADGFVALPGGFGTMEEIFEMLTWRQLGISRQPCAFLNSNDYYVSLLGMLDHMVQEGFLPEQQRNDLWAGADIDAMMAWMSLQFKSDHNRTADRVAKKHDAGLI